MAERLPVPVLQVGFEPSASTPDCLRSALQTAKRLGLGVLFERGETEYIVHPWLDVPQVLALYDEALSASVQEHGEVHRG